MKRLYKFPISPCNRPSEYRTEAQCTSTVMNLCRNEIQRMVDKDESKILAADYRFFDWDWSGGFVTAVYNPHPKGETEA